MKRLFPIARKVNLIIVATLVVGIGVLIGYFAFTLNATRSDTTRESLRQQADILYQSIQNAMLSGNAPVAVSLLTDVKDINPAFDIVLYRAGGVEAFSDNTTLEGVNRRLGRQQFMPKQVLPATVMTREGDSLFRQAVSERRNLLFQHSAEARTFTTTYRPLLNLPKCTRCHGSDHTVRGVIAITEDITPVVSQSRTNVGISGAFFVVMVAVLTLVLTAFMHAAVIRPVKHIGEVCAAVTQGEFDLQVQVPNRDEIGALGDTVNQMVQGLYERFQLSKFVSSSTLQSIKNRERGAAAEMTLLFSDVRSFTGYAERHSPEEVVQSLNRLLNVQTEIIHRNGGDVDKYVGDAVVAIFSGTDKEAHACRSALQIQREVVGRREVYHGLAVGVGINTGEVILGLVGSETRADFTVIGDAVNVASRLCDAARPGVILVSGSTAAAVRGRAGLKGPLRLRVKGKDRELSVYQLLRLRSPGRRGEE